MTRILVTGAAGRIGTAVVPLLRADGHELRLLDVERPSAADDPDEVLVGSTTDLELMERAAQGIELLVHLASFPSERPWPQIVDVNIESAYVVLEAARRAAVPVTVLASSVHAAGFTPYDAADARVVPARPDSLYGVSKVVGEALGSVYADRFGRCVVSARIMTFDTRPRTVRALGTWVSPADLVRLFLAVRTAPAGHHIIWGVSTNTRLPVSLAAGRALGYEPVDDAEEYAEQVAYELGVDGVANLPGLDSNTLGGEFTDQSHPLGEIW